MTRLPQDVEVAQPVSGIAVAVFSGEHDLATRDAVAALLGSLVQENDVVVVDFSGANLVDAATLRVVRDTDLVSRERGSSFRLQLGTVPIVERAFEVSGLLEQLNWAPTREEALFGSGHRHADS